MDILVSIVFWHFETISQCIMRILLGFLRPSRGSTHSNVVIDFDWYGNSAPINHLVEGKRTIKNLNLVGFETQLRQYGQVSKFKASKPWDYTGKERSLDRVTPIDQDMLSKTGFQHNAHYSSVDVIDRKKEIRDKLPDHLTLPQYSDKFVA